VLADALGVSKQAEESHGKPAWLPRVVTAGVVILLLLVGFVVEIPRNREALLAKVGSAYPVGACDFIRAQHLPQPIFNAYEWGGFLTWYLPEYPVAIDGRNDLYGDDVIIQYSKVMNADLPYKADPALADAQTILLRRDSLMGQALRTVPEFKVAYSDQVAVVLVKP
jgi:hypothetical protein